MMLAPLLEMAGSRLTLHHCRVGPLCVTAMQQVLGTKMQVRYQVKGPMLWAGTLVCGSSGARGRPKLPFTLCLANVIRPKAKLQLPPSLLRRACCPPPLHLKWSERSAAIAVPACVCMEPVCACTLVIWPPDLVHSCVVRLLSAKKNLLCDIFAACCLALADPAPHGLHAGCASLRGTGQAACAHKFEAFHHASDGGEPWAALVLKQGGSYRKHSENQD